MYNYQIMIEVPRTLRTKQGEYLTVDRFVQFLYNKKNKDAALKAFASRKNLAYLKSQGLKLTASEVKKYKNHFDLQVI